MNKKRNDWKRVALASDRRLTRVRSILSLVWPYVQPYCKALEARVMTPGHASGETDRVLLDRLYDGEAEVTDFLQNNPTHGNDYYYSPVPVPREQSPSTVVKRAKNKEKK